MHIRKIILSALTFFAFQSMAAQDLPVLICHSTKNVDGWVAVDTYEKLHFTAYIENNESLKRAVISGAFESDTGDMTAVADKENKYSRTKYSILEDAWCWFNVLLPKNVLDENGDFKGAVQYICEEQRSYTYVDMNCFIKR